MNPDPIAKCTSENIDFLSGGGAIFSFSAPPEGSEGILPLMTHENTKTAVETEKPSRAGEFGEGSDGSVKRIASDLRDADVDTAAGAPRTFSTGATADKQAAEPDAASRSHAHKE